MEAPLPHSGLWGLALLPPTLLLAALCARCRRGYGVQVDNYEYKPPHSVAPSSFIVMGPRCPPPPLEDDYTNDAYVTGYVQVLPEPEGAGPSAPPSEEYENLPDDRSDSRADSLEYINLPPPGSAPASESEDGAPDYENL
ncbi:linker for activation of T-cells family member 1 isoform X4 [Cuculus canorus]|uniref:linker for activation of T-cells family member 1 isoform X4 n=1 Tax=Cuculus canorus TaxID=55661 RepID=UPI0023AB3092|nr:linker for activation of T-cells family member 1 isoform X4 [Cuculus canorus]